MLRCLMSKNQHDLKQATERLFEFAYKPTDEGLAVISDKRFSQAFNRARRGGWYLGSANRKITEYTKVKKV